jgi:ABC-type multidrug transport system ATPase subunit
MEIKAENLGKRFNKFWVFRKFSFTFHSNFSYAITGPNGSGKSTLLHTLAGIIPSSEGILQYSTNNKSIPGEEIYNYLSIAAPYQELIEEFTLIELLDFHFKFKKLKDGLSKADLIELLRLGDSRTKEIRHFSSGMKMRLKLGLAFYSDTPILLLDEPTSNLDAKGTDWYLQEIKRNLANRLVIICSNQPHEYEFCSHTISMEQLI